MASETQAVAVVGAGLMGVGIAVVMASAHVACSIFDPDVRTRESLRERAEIIASQVNLDAEELLGFISVHAELQSAVQDATIVIEAGPENVAVKHSIFASLEGLVAPSTILASNTSAIPIGVIAEAVARPERVVGTHFWNPPYLVPLVEVVQSTTTSLDVVRETIAFLNVVGLKPVHVRVDVPGFVGNRMQHALKREAIALVANGVCSAETIDTVVRYGFGRRLALVGPLEQADLGGTDLTLSIHEIVMPDLDVTPVPHPYLVDMVARGDLGAKSGRGFYEWGPGEAERRRAEISQGLLDQSSSRDAATTDVSEKAWPG